MVGVVLLDFLAGVEAEVEDESDGFRFRLAEDRSSPLAVGDGDIYKDKSLFCKSLNFSSL